MIVTEKITIDQEEYKNLKNNDSYIDTNEILDTISKELENYDNNKEKIDYLLFYVAYSRLDEKDFLKYILTNYENMILLFSLLPIEELLESLNNNKTKDFIKKVIRAMFQRSYNKQDSKIYLITNIELLNMFKYIKNDDLRIYVKKILIENFYLDDYVYKNQRRFMQNIFPYICDYEKLIDSIIDFISSQDLTKAMAKSIYNPTRASIIIPYNVLMETLIDDINLIIDHTIESNLICKELIGVYLLIMEKILSSMDLFSRYNTIVDKIFSLLINDNKDGDVYTIFYNNKTLLKNLANVIEKYTETRKKVPLDIILVYFNLMEDLFEDKRIFKNEYLQKIYDNIYTVTRIKELYKEKLLLDFEIYCVKSRMLSKDLSELSSKLKNVNNNILETSKKMDTSILKNIYNCYVNNFNLFDDERSSHIFDAFIIHVLNNENLRDDFISFFADSLLKNSFSKEKINKLIYMLTIKNMKQISSPDEYLRKLLDIILKKDKRIILSIFYVYSAQLIPIFTPRFIINNIRIILEYIKNNFKFSSFLYSFLNIFAEDRNISILERMMRTDYEIDFNTEYSNDVLKLNITITYSNDFIKYSILTLFLNIAKSNIEKLSNKKLENFVSIEELENKYKLLEMDPITYFAYRYSKKEPLTHTSISIIVDKNGRERVLINGREISLNLKLYYKEFFDNLSNYIIPLIDDINESVANDILELVKKPLKKCYDYMMIDDETLSIDKIRPEIRRKNFIDIVKSHLNYVCLVINPIDRHYLQFIVPNKDICYCVVCIPAIKEEKNGKIEILDVDISYRAEFFENTMVKRIIRIKRTDNGLSYSVVESLEEFLNELRALKNQEKIENYSAMVKLKEMGIID